MRRTRVVCLSLVTSFPAWADPLDPKDVPAPLKPWVPWALHGAELQTCPRVPTEAEGRACVWPARLSLEVSGRGGRFGRTSRSSPGTWCSSPVTPSTGRSTCATVEVRSRWYRAREGRPCSSARGRMR